MNALRDWLNGVFGIDGGRGVQAIIALLVAIGLLLAIAWLFRRLVGNGLVGGKGALQGCDARSGICTCDGVARQECREIGRAHV